MTEAELLIRKTESLPHALFKEAVNYIDYLSQKAQSTYFSEKLSEAEREAAKPNAVWLDENEFWNEDDWNTASAFHPMQKMTKMKLKLILGRWSAENADLAESYEPAKSALGVFAPLRD